MHERLTLHHTEYQLKICPYFCNWLSNTRHTKDYWICQCRQHWQGGCVCLVHTHQCWTKQKLQNWNIKHKYTHITMHMSVSNVPTLQCICLEVMEASSKLSTIKDWDLLHQWHFCIVFARLLCSAGITNENEFHTSSSATLCTSNDVASGHAHSLYLEIGLL